MKTTTKRLKSIGLDEYEGACAYFRAMAEKGLILEDAGFLCYTFRKDLPQRVRYSIQNFPGGCDKKDAHYIQNSGWTFICDDNDYVLFHGDDDAKELEIPIKDQIRRWRTRQEEINQNITTLLKTGGGYLLLNVLSAISGGISDAILVLHITIGFFWFHQMIGKLLSLKRVRMRAESLIEGEIFAKDENWRRKIVIAWVGNLFTVVAWLVIIWGVWIA